MNDFDAPWSDHRDELYARVVRRGRTIQWQRRAIAGTVAAIVLVIPLAAHAAVTGPSSHVEVTPSSTTTVVPGRATTSTSSPSTTTTTTNSTASTNPGAPASSPTSTAPVNCHNSYDLACGDFRWDRPPPTDPFVVLQSPAQVAATVGEPVDVRFGMDGMGYSVGWGDGSDSQFGTFILPSECDGGLGAMRGPWTPPAAPNADNLKTESHSFAAPGTYNVSVEVFVGCIQQRLTGTRTVHVTVVVTPATTTTSGG